MLELLDTKKINETTLVDAVKRLNEAFKTQNHALRDSIDRWADRDLELKEEIGEVKEELKGVNHRLEKLEGEMGEVKKELKGVNHRLEKLETGQEITNRVLNEIKTNFMEKQDETNELLKQLIAKN